MWHFIFAENEENSNVMTMSLTTVHLFLVKKITPEAIMSYDKRYLEITFLKMLLKSTD